MTAFDTIVRGGTVIDGTANAVPTRADVGISDGRIVALGDLERAASPDSIDATDRIVAPGFLDTHVHSEAAILSASPDLEGSISQGVTTHLTGPDGFGWAGVSADGGAALANAYRAIYGDIPTTLDWADPGTYLQALTKSSPVNVVPMIPHQAVRYDAMGWAPGQASSDQLQHMLRIIDVWMEAGAAGLATGLDYQPAAGAGTAELTTLVRQVGRYGGVYAAHQRVRAYGRRAAWMETREIARTAGCRAVMSHSWIGDDVADLTDGMDGLVAFDWYAYPAGSTQLLSILPIESQVGGPAAVLSQLRDPLTRPRLEAELAEWFEQATALGDEAVFAEAVSRHRIGQTLSELVEGAPGRPGQTLARILEEELPDGLLVFRRHVEDREFLADVARTLQHPRCMIASDGIYRGGLPHPRAYGCFARVLGLFVREQGILPLSEAIHRMTGLPAAWYGLKDRGLIEVGKAADLVVFDPRTVNGPASWTAPRTRAIGVEHVLVNGAAVVRDGAATSARPGCLIGH